MRTYKEKLESLSSNSVWVFTKQETNFNEAFKAAKMFSEIKDKEHVNIEKYFIENHDKYDIQTNRHRILVIPQFYGLITKTPFYERGGTYNDENCTEAFDELEKVALDSQLFNVLKTEQVLKLKIHAIIDTADNNHDYNILPVIFIYKVLRTLKEKYNIDKITIGQLYTYVMTCKNYSELDEAVEFIHENAPCSKYLDNYKSRSRVLVCIRKNINLFNIDSECISINTDFDNYFNDNFIMRYDIDELHNEIIRDVDYSYFLHNIQNFNVNLIDKPNVVVTKDTSLSKVDLGTYDNENDEKDYIDKVDKIREININEDAGNEAYKIQPIISSKLDSSRKYRTNPLLGKIAIKKAYYVCENNYDHETFISKTSHKPYMEAHHLVPVCYQKLMWDRYGINIDCVENLVSLCPTCHKAIHYGTKETQRKIIEKLYYRCVPKYKSIGFNITLDEVLALYKIYK